MQGTGGEGNPHPAEALKNIKAETSGSWKQLRNVGGEKPFHPPAMCCARGERVLGAQQNHGHTLHPRQGLCSQHVFPVDVRKEPFGKVAKEGTPRACTG